MEIEEYNYEANNLYTPALAPYYLKAAEIVHIVSQQLEAIVVEGKNCMDICELGDKLMRTHIHAARKEIKAKTGVVVEAGIMFPTCASVNNCLGNYSATIPSANIYGKKDKFISASVDDKDQLTPFKAGDVVKVDLAVHISGCISTTGHSMYIRNLLESPEQPIKGSLADAYCSLQLLNDYLYQNVLFPGTRFSTITKAIRLFTKAFDVSPVKGTFSNNLQRYSLDGDKLIPSVWVDNMTAPTDFVLEENEIYLIDLAISTGTGVTIGGATKASVFRRNIFQGLRSDFMDADTRIGTVVNSIVKAYPATPFSIRWITEQCMDSKGDLSDLFNIVSLDAINSTSVNGGNKNTDFDTENPQITKNNVDALVRMATTTLSNSHDSLLAFPILFEKPNEKIVRFKTTVVITKKGPICLSTLSKCPYAISDKTIDIEKVNSLLTETI